VTLLAGGDWRAAAQADAERRDFTVNGLFYEPFADNVTGMDGEILDFVGGVDDLGSRTLRAIGDPAARFAEDHLRMLRLARLSVQLEFGLDPATAHAAAAGAANIRAVSSERVLTELTRILLARHAAVGLTLLADLGLASHIGATAENDGGASLHDMGVMSGQAIDAVARLPWPRPIEAALAAWIAQSPDARELPRHLGFSNAISNAVPRLLDGVAQIPGALGGHARRARALLDRGDVSSVIAVATALRRLPPDAPGAELAHRADGAESMPDWLNGDTLQSLGLTPGPALGSRLREARDAWLDGRFDDRAGLRRWMDDQSTD
jgi:tRNA nucleotidyltransferase/poly(A) polymerase